MRLYKSMSLQKEDVSRDLNGAAGNMADDCYNSQSAETPLRVAYIYNEELVQLSNGLPKIPDRVSI